MSTLAPINDGELIRSFNERIRKLENGATQRVGNWVLADKGGLLTAVFNDGSSTVLGGGEAVDFSSEIQTALTGALSKGKYVSADDLADALGGFSGVANSGLAQILAQVKTWSAQLAALGPLTKALTGISGGLSDLTTWAGTIPALVGGLLDGSWIPGLDASKIISGLFPQAMVTGLTTLAGNFATTLTNLFGGSSPLSQIIAGAVPGLDAAKIITGTFAQSMVTGLTTLASNFATTLTNLFGGSTPLSTIIAGAVPGLDAAKIITGTFAQSMVTGLTTLASNVASTLTNLFSGGTPASTILASAVPGLDTSKITSGTFALSIVSGLTGYLSNLTSLGVWSGSLTSAATVAGTAITTLLANITSGGLFDSGKLQNVTGTIAASLIGALDAAKITTGTFAQSMVTGLTTLASNVASTLTNLFSGGTPGATILASAVPGLDTSKITSGTFALSIVSGLTGYLTNLTSGGVWSGSLTSAATVAGTAITTLLGNITSGGLFDSGKLSNVTGTIGASLIGALDAAKITTGTFAQSMVTGLTTIASNFSTTLTNLFGGSTPLTQIITGAVPGIDASKVTSGQFLANQIANVLGGSDLGVDLGALADGIVNAVTNAGASGSVAHDAEVALAKLPTLIKNAFGAVPVSRATSDDALTTLVGVATTMSTQGQQIASLLAKTTAGALLSRTMQVPQLVIQTGTGSYNMLTSAPSWWTLGTDPLSGMAIGSGAGGDGAGVSAGLGGNGGSATLTVSGVGGSTITGTGGVRAAAAPTVIGSAAGNTSFDDTLFQGGGSTSTYNAAGNPPGGGGMAGLGAGKYGGGAGNFATGHTWIPAVAATVTGTLAAGGAAGGGAGGAGGAGGGSRAWGLFRKAIIAADWTASASVRKVQLYRMVNGGAGSGATYTDAQTANAIWNAAPGGTGDGHLVFIRCDTACNNLVYLLVDDSGGNTTYELGCYTGGTNHVFQTGTWTGVTIPANAFGLRADAARNYTVSVNGIDQFTYSDSGAVSAAPSSSLRWGGWGSSDTSVAAKQSHGSLALWTMIDSGTPSTQVYTESTTSATVTATSFGAPASGGAGPGVSIVVPPNGKVDVALTMFGSSSAISGRFLMGVVLSGTNTLAASNANSLALASVAGGTSASGTVEISLGQNGTPLNPGTTTFTPVFLTSTGTATLLKRAIRVTPVA